MESGLPPPEQPQCKSARGSPESISCLFFFAKVVLVLRKLKIGFWGGAGLDGAEVDMGCLWRLTYMGRCQFASRDLPERTSMVNPQCSLAETAGGRAKTLSGVLSLSLSVAHEINK